MNDLDKELSSRNFQTHKNEESELVGMPVNRVSRLAISAFILSFTGLCTIGLTSVLSILIAIAALFFIRTKRNTMKGKPFAIIAITISLLTLVILNAERLSYFTPGLKMKMIHNILKSGRLGNIPQSAKNVKVWGWQGIFTGEDFITFQAEPNEIDKFVTNSPSIKDITPEIFTSEHMYLPYSKRENISVEDYQKHRRYIQPHDNPKWFEPTIRVKGRRYEIPPDKDLRGHNSGEVIINDETNTVYINVIWS
jgi:hypothetical protein